MTAANAWVRDAWMKSYGRIWMDRNVASVAALDQLRKDGYGITQQELNALLFAGIPLEASVLEPGCNAGRQLDAMNLGGHSKLFGSDLSLAPLRVCRWNPVQADLVVLPYRTGAVDVVFTSGTLIHLPPEILGHAIKEMLRVSKTWVIGVEPWRPAQRAVTFGGAVEGQALLPTVWANDWPTVWAGQPVTVEWSHVYPRINQDGFGLAVYRCRKAA